MDNKIPNGGFPPIKYCKEKNTKKKIFIEKERFFYSNSKINNLNIRKIIFNKPKKKFFLDEQKSEDDELDSIE